jgi:hypothetical protein
VQHSRCLTYWPISFGSLLFSSSDSKLVKIGGAGAGGWSSSSSGVEFAMVGLLPAVQAMCRKQNGVPVAG